MQWFLMLLIFISGIYYLINQSKVEMREKTREKTIAAQMKDEKIKSAEEPPLPVKPEKIILLKFSLQTLKTLRLLCSDSNENVRFAAVELLWQLQDDQAPAYIKNMFQEETEPAVKKLLINMVAKDKSKLSLALLAEAMNDFDIPTRLLAVEAIGNFCNKEAVTVLNKGLQDYDETVRLKSLEAVNNIRRDIEAHREQQLRELVKEPLFRIE